MLSRFVVVDKLYHQTPNESPVGEALAFSRSVESDDVPYSRPIKVGPNPVPIDGGWVEKVGTLLVRLPTGSESDLVVILGGFELVLQPGEHVRLPVTTLDGISLSASAEVRPVVTVYPR